MRFSKNLFLEWLPQRRALSLILSNLIDPLKPVDTICTQLDDTVGLLKALLCKWRCRLHLRVWMKNFENGYEIRMLVFVAAKGWLAWKDQWGFKFKELDMVRKNIPDVILNQMTYLWKGKSNGTLKNRLSSLPFENHSHGFTNGQGKGREVCPYKFF